MIRRIAYEAGRALRETGQALDRLGEIFCCCVGGAPQM